MNDPVPDPTPPEISRALVVACMQAAERAVGTVNTALTIQFTQPVQAPGDAQAWREQLLMIAAQPVQVLWNAIEPVDRWAAGGHLFVALLREVIDTSAAGLAKIRQFSGPPPAVDSPSPAPGSSTQEERERP